MNLVKRSTGLDALSGEIHECFGFQEEAFFAIQIADSIESLVSFLPFIDADVFGQPIQKKKPDIMPSFPVFPSWIPESDNELHG